MSRSYKHTPIAWYAPGTPGHLKFLKRSTSSWRRRVVRDLLAQARYDDINTRRPKDAFEWDAKEGRYWWSRWIVVSQHEHRGWYRYRRESYVILNPAEREWRWRQKWMRK